MANHDPGIESRRAYLYLRMRDADTKRDDSKECLDDLKEQTVAPQKLTEEVEDWLDTTTRYADEAYNNCVKFEVRLITDAMDEMLPRELRDMIWSLCWADSLNEYDDRNNERPWRAHSMSEDTVNGVEYTDSRYDIEPHERAQALGPYPIGYLADIEYMSQESARESAQMFYRMAPAFVETLDQWTLQHYFCNDIFRLGLEPRHYITSVVFFLHHCEFQENVYLGEPIRCLDTLELDQRSMDTIFGCRRDRLPLVVFRISGNAYVVVNLLEKDHDLFHQLDDICVTISFEWV